MASPVCEFEKNCFGIKSAVDLIPSRSSSQDEENCSNLMLPLAKFDYVDITNDCTLFHSRTRQGFLLMYLSTMYILTTYRLDRQKCHIWFLFH